MKKKYNIALTPASAGASFVTVAQSVAAIRDQYCLGPQSLPHVTLLQFHAHEQMLDMLWENACKKIKPHRLRLTFDHFSVTTNNTLFWVALMPDQRDILHHMHLSAIDVMQEQPSRPYDPHLTLINSRDLDCQAKTNALQKTYRAITDDFVLSLGHCDEHGQFTGLIKIG